MVDIVIINWNSGFYIKKCIDSIFQKQNAPYIGNVIVVDNNSADFSQENYLQYKKITVIKNQQNLGFSKACNQGFRLCNNRFTLLLNPDAMLLENTLRDCIEFMTNNQGIDILGCSLVDDKGRQTKSCARFPTPARFFFDASGLSKIAPAIFTPATLMTDWDHSQSKPVDQVMGAFMFMKTDLFSRIGYFDERFFVYFEELDFSLRLAKSGGISYFNSGIQAIHSGEGTTSSVKAFRLYLSLQSRLKYARKHFSSPGVLLVYLSTFPVEFTTRLLQLVFTGNFKDIKKLLQGYKMLILPPAT